MKKIKCKMCDFTANDGNLVPHVQENHPEITLKQYMDKHGGETSLIDQAILDATKPVKGTSVDLFGIEFKKRTGLDAKLKTMVPKVDTNYSFQDFTGDVCYDISKAHPVALTGHCGTGKTSLIYQLAAKLGVPVMRVNTNQQTTIADFVGTWIVKGGEMQWVDGALPFAMRHGCWLIIDEIDYAEPAILSALNAVLEPARTLMLKEKGDEIVEAHDDFRIFSTGNTLGQMSEFRSLYQGTSIMNEAFIDRWRLYLVGYLPEALEVKVVAGAVDGMTEKVARRLVQVAGAVRKAFVEETMQCTFSTRRLIDWAEMLVRHSSSGPDAPVKAAENTIFSKVSREDATAFRGYLQRVFFGR